MPTRYFVVSRLPRTPLKGKGICCQGDIRVNAGRLRAKLVVFETNKDMRAFWRKHCRNGLCRRTLGAVNSLAREVIEISPGEPDRYRTEVDARYFCIIGLLRKHLTMRVISHESVHAAFAFAKRRTRSHWDALAVSFDEEAIAYPVGEIARNITLFIQKRGMI